MNSGNLCVPLAICALCGKCIIGDIGPRPPIQCLRSPDNALVTKPPVCATGVGFLFEENTLNIFVGNLSFSTTGDDLSTAFAQYGKVESAQVIMDRQTGRSRGFGFVEMPDSGEAKAAISAMNGSDLQGRPLTVNEAKPRAPREDRGRW